jgi:hypothetical protein
VRKASDCEKTDRIPSPAPKARGPGKALPDYPDAFLVTKKPTVARRTKSAATAQPESVGTGVVGPPPASVVVVVGVAVTVAVGVDVATPTGVNVVVGVGVVDPVGVGVGVAPPCPLTVMSLIVVSVRSCATRVAAPVVRLIV